MNDKTKKIPIPDDIDQLKALCIELTERLEQQKEQQAQIIDNKNKRIASLEELVRFFRHYRFGKSSERYASPNQEELFNEAQHDQTTNDADCKADSSEIRGPKPHLKRKKTAVAAHHYLQL